MFENISVKDLKKMVDAEIIDIRSNQKYNDNHINNARNISYENLILNPSKYLNKFSKYYIYCQRGMKSKNLCQYLKKIGYDVVNVIGGYEAWILCE